MKEGFDILVITPENEHPEEVKAVQLLFESGLHLLHIRKPSLSAVSMASYLSRIPADLHPKLVMHSHFQLVRDFNVKGVHLNSRNSSYEEEKKVQISCSAHSIGELKENRGRYAYQFLSPLFDSISKPGYRAGFDLQEIAESLSETEEKVIALGGIDEYRISRVRSLGFSGAALMGCLWKERKPSDINDIFTRIIRQALVPEVL
jgi:thiamine monophosphate synthase